MDLINFNFLVSLCYLLSTKDFLIVNGHNIFPFATPCDSTDSELQYCLQSQWKLFMNSIQGGRKDLRLPQLNPFSLHYLPMPLDPDFVLEFWNVSVSGLTEADLNEFRYDYVHNAAYFGLHFNTIPIEARCRLRGVVFNHLTIDATGPIHVTLENVTVNIKIPYPRVKLPKSIYYQSDLDAGLSGVGIRWDGQSSDANFRMTQLLEYLSNNWTEVSDKYKPATMAVLKDIVLPILDRVSERIDLAKIIIEKPKKTRILTPTVQSSVIWYRI